MTQQRNNRRDFLKQGAIAAGAAGAMIVASQSRAQVPAVPPQNQVPAAPPQNDMTSTGNARSAGMRSVYETAARTKRYVGDADGDSYAVLRWDESGVVLASQSLEGLGFITIGGVQMASLGVHFSCVIGATTNRPVFVGRIEVKEVEGVFFAKFAKLPEIILTPSKLRDVLQGAAMFSESSLSGALSAHRGLFGDVHGENLFVGGRQVNRVYSVDRAPTAADDENADVRAGDMWRYGEAIYLCVGANAGAAVWKIVGPKESVALWEGNADTLPTTTIASGHRFSDFRFLEFITDLSGYFDSPNTAFMSSRGFQSAGRVRIGNSPHYAHPLSIVRRSDTQFSVHHLEHSANFKCLLGSFLIALSLEAVGANAKCCKR